MANNDIRHRGYTRTPSPSPLQQPNHDEDASLLVSSPEGRADEPRGDDDRGREEAPLTLGSSPVTSIMEDVPMDRPFLISSPDSTTTTVPLQTAPSSTNAISTTNVRIIAFLFLKF